jgi:hypothetical protein
MYFILLFYFVLFVYVKIPHWCCIYDIYKVTTYSFVNSFIYMVTSFDPKLRS